MKPNRSYISSAFFSLLLIYLLFTSSTISLAGDIPEVLAYDLETVLYFGEIKSVDEESITIIQKQNIKGDFTEGAEITYPADILFTEAPQVGSIYLCGYTDANNPIYVWETDSLDPNTLTIVNEDEMSKRMQQYLNDGTVQETEKKRLAQAQAQSQTSNASSISVIGGADGPTAVFIAGKLPAGTGSGQPASKTMIFVSAMIFIAIFAVTATIITLYLLVKRKRK